MSQSSGGKVRQQNRLDRTVSLAVVATTNAADAFGQELDDDQYSVSELSQVAEDRHRVTGKKETREVEKFERSTFGRSAAGLERTRSMAVDSSKSGGEGEDGPPEEGERRQMEGQRENGEGASASRSDEGASHSLESEENEAISTPSSFSIFAQTRFALKTSYTYSCHALAGPLLPKQDRADVLASLAIWVSILRIMGDLPDIDQDNSIVIPGSDPPLVSRVKSYFKRKYAKKDLDDALRKYSELFKDPSGADARGIPFLPDNKCTMLEKVQYVCALGIYRQDLRDELYCQLCKQLNNNPSRNSSVRGWVLLQLLTSCFAPTEKFAPCFQNFLLHGSPDLAHKVDLTVRRTCMVGTRSFPPSWLEFQAAKNSKPILLPVTFMNGVRLLFEVDAASTVQELCLILADRLRLADIHGFSIYVALQQRISCLGHGSHRVMDAISECEQHTKQGGMRESNSLWRLFFRKEFFSPWYRPEADERSTDLIYEQITRGVSLGEYKCEKEDVLVLMAAQRYVLENSKKVDDQKLDFFVRGWLPEEASKQHEPSYWTQKVKLAVENNFKDCRLDETSLKVDIVTFAMDKWFLLFSRFYDVSKLHGPGMSWGAVVVAVNCRGVYVMDESDTIRTHFNYVEIASVWRSRQAVHVSTLKGEEYSITSTHTEDFFQLLNSFLEGLRARSTFAVVLHDFKQLDPANGCNVSRGELLELAKPFGECEQEDVFKVKVKRSGQEVTLPRDVIYVLATTQEPAADLMGMLTVALRKDPGIFQSQEMTVNATLQHYAKMSFRRHSESTVSKFLSRASLKRDKSDCLWQFSKEPLRKPLLKKLVTKEEIRRVACRVFLAILQYMGDVPLKEDLSEFTLVSDVILEPARRNRYLRDEIYCQVIKQLTHNPDKTSEERGWQLMLMLVSICLPGSELLEELLSFLKASKHASAKPCLDRLHTCKALGCRLYVLHPQELEMYNKQQPSIRVQIVAPDGTVQTHDVQTMTRVGEIKREVCNRLKVKTMGEYGLYLSFRSSMHSLPDWSYYFDSLSYIEAYKMRHKGDATPTLVILKKVWVNAKPGEDTAADDKFHFPQELPNYLRGYHQCTRTEAEGLAALVFIARHGQDQTQLSKLRETLQTLVPQPLLSGSNPEDWIKAIERHVKDQGAMTSTEAKTAFLNTACTWPTYGCVFFEVKQRSRPNLPKKILMAINVAGVHLIDPESKSLLVTYEFPKIPNWAYDDVSFTLVLQQERDTSKLLLETNLGHNMDDILMTYISWLMNAQMRKKHGYTGTFGESVC